MKITRAGETPSRIGPADWFTGRVRMDPLFTAEDPGRAGGTLVTFEPGARTAWHTHPAGQTIFVTQGVGRAQRAGGPVEIIRPGDVVAWAAGVENGHHLQNRSNADCVFVAISAGSKDKDSGEYPDIDMVFDAEGYARKDGTRYAAKRTP